MSSCLTIAVLHEFGLKSLGIEVGDLDRPGKVVQLGVEPNRIDLITSISGVEFDEAWKNRVSGELDGVPVQYIGFDDLLRNKQSTGRGKDLGDAEYLRDLKAFRDKA